MSDPLRPHELHARLPCLSVSPTVYSNSCPLSQWCCLTISASATPFSFYLQSFPASGSFPRCQFFASGDLIGILASASVLVMNIQEWFPLGWTGLISWLSKRLSRVFSELQFESINSLVLSLFYGPTLTSIHDYWKNHSFAYTDLCCKVTYLLFIMLSRFAIAFIPRRKHLLISHLLTWGTHLLVSYLFAFSHYSGFL